MRLLLPLVCGVITATALVPPLRAEGDTIVVQSLVVQPVAFDSDEAKPTGAALPSATPIREDVVLSATPAMPADELAAALPRDRQKSDNLRGSVLMLLLPNLCCR